MILINLSKESNDVDYKMVAKIIDEVEKYCLTHEIEEYNIVSIEDSTWSDPVNQRHDVSLRYHKNGHFLEQKLLFLKGELLDGEEFHKRAEEFYPRLKEAVA